MTSIKLLHDKGVVERVEAEGKSKGGIVLPDTAREMPREGTVIASGPGRAFDTVALSPVGVKKGDRVLFAGFEGSEIKLNGKVYGDMMKFGVIDPTKAVRCALQYAASVASLLLTTDAMISDIPEHRAVACSDQERSPAQLRGSNFQIEGQGDLVSQGTGCRSLRDHGGCQLGGPGRWSIG